MTPLEVYEHTQELARALKADFFILTEEKEFRTVLYLYETDGEFLCTLPAKYKVEELGIGLSDVLVTCDPEYRDFEGERRMIERLVNEH